MKLSVALVVALMVLCCCPRLHVCDAQVNSVSNITISSTRMDASCQIKQRVSAGATPRGERGEEQPTCQAWSLPHCALLRRRCSGTARAGRRWCTDPPSAARLRAVLRAVYDPLFGDSFSDAQEFFFSTFFSTLLRPLSSSLCLSLLRLPHKLKQTVEVRT
jgi:hypothetical protein